MITKLIPPTRTLPYCNFCVNVKMVEMIRFIKNRKMFINWACPVCGNTRQTSYNELELAIMNKFKSQFAMDISEIKRICKHLKRVHKISELQLTNALKDYSDERGKIKYLNIFADNCDKLEWLNNKGITEFNSTKEFERIIKCLIFRRRYMLKHICLMNHCINIDLCFDYSGQYQKLKTAQKRLP